MYLVISTSLNPQSRSRALAIRALAHLAARNEPSEFIDLQHYPLPACDGGRCYGDPRVVDLSAQIRAAQGILVAGPVYNYDLGSSAKNLVEVTGKAWRDKVVGFLVSAGGQGSWMATLGLANSLMLDFRCLIVPRFVYATESMVSPTGEFDPEIIGRIDRLVDDLLRLAPAWHHPDLRH